MLKIGSQHPMRRTAVLGYGVAVLSVFAAVVALWVIQARWQPAAQVSFLLIAVIITTRFGGAGAGVMATALALLGLNYLLPQIRNPPVDWPIHLLHLMSFAAVACYVVWITATDRRRAQDLTRARDEQLRHNEALRAENLERKRTEEELRASEAKFRALAESAPAAIFICQDDRITYSNPAATVITGFSSAELFGKSFWDTAVPDSRESVRARAVARRSGEAVPARFELKILTKDGAERCLDFTEEAFSVGGKRAVLGIAFDITDRKQAEEAVRNSQQLLNQVLATLPVGVAVTNRGGDIILANAILKNIWGELPVMSGPSRWAHSKGWWHDSGERVVPSEWASVRALSTGQTSLNEVIDIENFTGERKTIQNSAAPIYSTEGQIVGAVIVNQDVTQRVRAESAVRKSERVLREAEELGHTGSWEHDLVKGEIYSTPENLRLFFGDDRSKGERLEDYVEAVHPDDRAYVQARHEELLEEGGPRDVQFRVVWPDGSVHTLVGQATVVRDPSGRSVRLYGTNVDVTERKRVEEAMRQSQQLLNLVLETLPVGVAVTDQAGNIVLSNAASRRIWGQKMIHSGDERWVRSVGYGHDSGERLAPAQWPSVRALRDGQVTLNELIDIVAFDGRPKTIQASAAPIHGAEKLIVGAVVVMDEVTERVRAEEALHESADRLQHLSRRLLAVQEEERRHLSRELHDEFGQLLASITMHLQAARISAGPAVQPNLDESIALLQRAGAQVRSLALELRPMLLETAGLGVTLRWLADQYQQRTGVITQVAGHVPDVSGEVAIACFRIVQEALTNVVRHARAKHVWIELGQSEGLLELMVRDDGEGFDVPRMLERAASGGNLGLIGMRERVEILGGQLEVNSQPGHGTRIRVLLPLSEAARVPEPQRA
jgi:PAS domain S-box-containing protein